VPAATPLPRGPSVLALYGAADLLSAPGCPVCRYVTEASDRYAGWFALEGHSQPELITTLCESAGMCARHTRVLMSQPGAATRLTPVYRYVLTGVRDRLAAGTLSPAACPACMHDVAAAGRALDTLLDGLAEAGVLRLCQELGGVCLPHLRAAAGRGSRRTVADLAQIVQETLATSTAGSEWLAGTDYDAEVRICLRQEIPARSSPVPALCGACLAAAEAERDSLARATGPGTRDPHRTGGGLGLCAGHLAESVVLSSSGQCRDLLERQFGGLAASRRSTADRIGPLLARRLRPGATSGRSGDCPVCRESTAAALRALASARGAALCIRHQAALRSVDRRASRELGPESVAVAAELIGELAEAFELTTWAGRRDAGPAPPSNAWRRAAAYLNGGVFAGLLA